MQNPFRYFSSSPEANRLAAMMYIRYPLSLRQVEDILFERGIDICHEAVPLEAAEAVTAPGEIGPDESLRRIVARCFRRPRLQI